MHNNPLSLIVRADDCGGNATVNEAIMDVYRSGNGLLRNVSLMANCPGIEDAARLFAGIEDLCFGVHLTLNAEWDRVRWGPVGPVDQLRSLIDEEGFLYRTPQMFQAAGVDVDEVFAEMDHQLEKLRSLGFEIRYADEHMVFGDQLPGYVGRFEQWCRDAGLVNWRHCLQRIPDAPKNESTTADLVDVFINRLEQLVSGTYTLITHPAFDTPEMRQFGHRDKDGETISRERNADRLLLKSERFRRYCDDREIRILRYDEALQSTPSPLPLKVTVPHGHDPQP